MEMKMEVDKGVQITTNICGDVCLRKARRKRQRLLITELAHDYTKNTSLHGIPYITKKGLTMSEKIFWIITFIISVCWCSVCIYQLWIRWKTSPVIVTISEEVVSVGMVPFPSVTICPQSKIKTSVYNYTDDLYQIRKLMNETDVVLYEYETNSSVYLRISKKNDIYNICGANYIPINRNFTNSSMVEHIYQVSLDNEDIFELCELKTEQDGACKRTFKRVLTKEGVCFTANTLAFDEMFRIEKLQHEFRYLNSTRQRKGWAIEEGYDNTELDPYPMRGTENAATPDLIVILYENTTERDQTCNVLNSGFKVYIHHPLDLPQSTLHYYAAIAGQVSSVALSFSILNTSESLRSYSAEARQCYFSDERYLKYFHHYTAKNCWIECISNYTFEKCGCVEFYIPHSSSEQICSEGRFKCIMDAKEELVRKEAASSDGCHCLPACISVDYEAEILKTTYNVKESLKAYDSMYQDNTSSVYQGLSFSKLELYYKRPRFLSMRRSELFGVTAFLANCGGLLGLFMGFSFLTLVEIIYFLTLRLWCTLKKDLKEEKTRAKMEQEELKKRF